MIMKRNMNKWKKMNKEIWKKKKNMKKRKKNMNDEE